jgi:hypothetical protein
VRELEFSAFGGILVTRTELVREIQFPNQLNMDAEIPPTQSKDCGYNFKT